MSRHREVRGLLVLLVALIVVPALIWLTDQRVPRNEADPYAARLHALDVNARVVAYLSAYQSLLPFIEDAKNLFKLEIDENWHPQGVRAAIKESNGDVALALTRAIDERKWRLTQLGEALAQAALPDGEGRRKLIDQLESDRQKRDEMRVFISSEIDKVHAEYLEESIRILGAKGQVGDSKVDALLKDSIAVRWDFLLLDLRWQVRQLTLHRLDPENYPDGPAPTQGILDSAQFPKK